MKELQSDAVIVGAGPSGLVCGALLARAGHRVVILDGETEPSEGVLLLTRFGLQVLDELGWLEPCQKIPGAVPHSSIRLRNEAEQLDLAASTELLTVSRKKAIEMMASNAVAEGASLLYGVMAVAPEWDSRRICGVRARTNEGDDLYVQAHATIDASGVESFLAAAIGQLQPRTGPPRCRFSALREGAENQRLELAIVEDTWLLQTPGSPGVVNVLAPCDVEQPERTRALAEALLLRVAEDGGDLLLREEGKLTVVGYRPRVRAGDGWATVGEAAVGVGLGLPGTLSLGLSIAASAAWEVDLVIRHQRAFGKSQMGATLTLIRQASNMASVFERSLADAARLGILHEIFRPGWRQGAAIDLLCGSWLPIRRRWRAIVYLWWLDGKVRRSSVRSDDVKGEERS